MLQLLTQHLLMDNLGSITTHKEM